MTEPLEIAIRGVVKRFGNRQVLNGLDLDVHPGETVALVGPSGAGKSTLLRCINGLTTFDAGEIRIGPHSLRGGEGRPPHDTVGQIRRLVGMIFQDFQLFPHLTALGNVAEAPVHVLRIPKRQARERAMELLARVGLADRADAYPRELSGGQKQRIAIARAMAMEPRGLLCDEITSALDPELKQEVLVALESLKREGLTLILVTHELAFARRSADRIVVLDAGQVIEEGPPEQVFERPQQPRTQRLLKDWFGIFASPSASS
jgi:polar amino acid transport system ATP-binding protein